MMSKVIWAGISGGTTMSRSGLKHGTVQLPSTCHATADVATLAPETLSSIRLQSPKHEPYSRLLAYAVGSRPCSSSSAHATRAAVFAAPHDCGVTRNVKSALVTS